MVAFIYILRVEEIPKYDIPSGIIMRYPYMTPNDDTEVIHFEMK